jgi:hypothetical protein
LSPFLKIHALPKTTKHISTSIPDLEIRSEGIEKLLKNINSFKASGPDVLPKWLRVVILQSFHYSVIYVIPFCFSYLAFTFFLEVFVVCPLLLKNINPSKASGPDNIPNRILKECAKQLAPGLTSIYHKSFHTGTLMQCD